MTVFKLKQLTKNLNIFLSTTILKSFISSFSLIFLITNLLIVNLFDLTICKLVIFFDFDFNLIIFLIYDNRFDYLFFAKNIKI